MGRPEFHRRAAEKGGTGIEPDPPAERGWKLVKKGAPSVDRGSPSGMEDPTLPSVRAELLEAERQLDETRELLAEERAVGLERLRQADEIREETALGAGLHMPSVGGPSWPRICPSGLKVVRALT